MLVGILSLSFIGCGGGRAIKPNVEIPKFPAFPQVSKEFYQKAPKGDLQKLLEREYDLTTWKEQMENRVKTLTK